MEDDYLTSQQPQVAPLRSPKGRRHCHYENDVVLNMYQETSFCPNNFVLDPVKNTFTAATRKHRTYGSVCTDSINNTFTAARNHHKTVVCDNSNSSPLTIYKNTEFAVIPLLHAEDEIYDRLTSCFKV